MQKEKLLPIQYRIEFYEGTALSDPVYFIETTTPPFSVSTGDKVDPPAWELSNFPTDKMYEVIEVTHLCWKIEDSHAAHSLSVALKTIDR